MKTKTLHELHLEAIEKDLFANNRLTTTDFAASKSAEITEKIAIEFGIWLFMAGIEFYDNLSDGNHYTIEGKQGTFTWESLFQEFLKTRI
jgi:hypothetical protein